MNKALVAVVLLAVAATGAYWYWRGSRPSPELLLAGTIEARVIEVGSLSGGRVARVLVQEGDTVEAGQPLVELETAIADAGVAERRAAVAAARAALERARRGPRSEEVARARINWQAAETDRKRFEQLLRDGVVGQRDYDRAQVAEATARQTLAELERGTRREDIDAAQAQLEQAEEALAYAERQRDELAIDAPARARIESLDLRPGDLLAPNQPAATLLEEDQLWVRVYVPEPKLGRVRVGQEAAVRIDSFPNRDFPGRVSEIRHQAEYTPRNVQTLDQRNDQFFGVKVTIDPAPELRPGMAVLVRLAEPAGAAAESAR
jgi:multidrug resistance efflux pump